MKKEIVKKGIVKFATGLPVFNHHAAGIDIGDTLQCVAISDGNNGHEVKTTSSFTCDLEEILVYLLANKITTAAMESTGVYWLPLYLMLEEAGIDVYLVNAKHVKNVTGRKKDDTDAIWIQKLHTCGLLQKSFQPDSHMRVLRDYTLIEMEVFVASKDCILTNLRRLWQTNVSRCKSLKNLLNCIP